MATNAGDVGDPAKTSMETMESGNKVSTASKLDNFPIEEDVPDPEEDDLDDLDGESLFNLGQYYN
jgi:hypothetical protein